MTTRCIQCCCSAVLAMGISLVGHWAPALADWNRFRGPNGTGVAEGPAPVQWSPTQNLKWKIPLPGPGVSSPIVIGDRLFVTCYSGYGVSRDNVGDMEQLQRHLLCINAKTGEQLWQQDIPNTAREDAFSGMGVPSHGYASHTPTSDGEHVYVFFGKGGVLAFDFEGKQLWQADVGTDSDPRRWGSSSSPILIDNVLVVTAGPESRALIGLDKATGQELWRADSDGFGMVWGTPAIAPAGDLEEIVIGAPYEIWALNPENGKLRWYCDAMDTESFSSSIVVQHDKIFAIEGRGGGSIAVQTGGRDDVTKTKVLWSGRDNGRFGTPIVVGERLYSFSGGVVTCLDTSNGEEVFRERLRSSSSQNTTSGTDGGGRRGGRGGRGFGGMDYSSPVTAAGKIYYTNGRGETFVIAAGTEFEQLAVNQVTGDNETFSATPAISDGAIYLRSDKHLYCVAND